MRNQKLYQNISQAYLSVIPPLTAAFGFTLNNINYQIYLSIWIINVFLMLAASWILGTHNIVKDNKKKKQVAASGFLLIAPWIFYSIFGGMGAPPETYAEWVSSAFEQQVRYSFLISGGILLIFGFAVLREKIKNTAGNIFALMGFTAITIAMILFVLNMSYWHSFVLETFKTNEVSSINQLPEWYLPVKKLFLVISIVEVALTYFAKAAFAAALKSAGWFRTGAARVYIIISLLAFLLVALYGLYPETVTTNGFPFYPFMIPAIPFIMPYYIGVNLLKRSGNLSPEADS